MRRLYLQIYLTVIGVLVLLAVLASLAWWMSPERRQQSRMLDELAGVVASALPADAGPAALARVLASWGERFDADIALHAADGEPIARFGSPLPPPPLGRERSGWVREAGLGAFALKLPDGRWLLARHPVHGDTSHAFGWLAALALLALAVAIGAYPVVRRLTGRLERLQRRVEALAAGDLSTRVQVEGRDEVADLARSFNLAADRIERLVGAQKQLLASASHELRSPLARLRMAVELLEGSERADLRERIARDIGELDELIGELLLASRLDAAEGFLHREDVELLDLAAEEAARAGVRVSGEPVHVSGDPRLLRRLLRNLLENAQRYAGGSDVDVTVGPGVDGGACLEVADRGPGVPEPERERIFAPFYRPAGLRESADGGVGLGLSLVRQIARHHGGEARCRPREGGGSIFEVTLAAASG